MDTPELIDATLKRAYRDMDPSTGMYPADWRCLKCDVVLNADGSHPAELHAGTFNGMCYRCTAGSAFVVPGSELPDGARRVSHPPACPSWRRDRTNHWSYPDCEKCKGLGAKRRYSWNGDHMENCRACLARVTAPRKCNEVEFLTTVADMLESWQLNRHDDNPPLTGTQWAVSAACNEVAAAALKRWENEPTIWSPQRYLLQQAESRLTAAQWKAKRPDTLRRHLVAALRAEASSCS